ncbi:unnamed protein product [Cercospora beticola]|nr:unnamed protein product [Cercospora beticola]
MNAQIEPGEMLQICNSRVSTIAFKQHKHHMYSDATDLRPALCTQSALRSLPQPLVILFTVSQWPTVFGDNKGVTMAARSSSKQSNTSRLASTQIRPPIIFRRTSTLTELGSMMKCRPDTSMIWSIISCVKSALGASLMIVAATASCDPQMAGQL